ncbi:MAG: serine hydrolase domain-containing protein [Candidatus Nanopelagicaceae bacterium]|nr:serine hydrolase domain-containing protein [Candidatus Nanopelagicaceae bacterium]
MKSLIDQTLTQVPGMVLGLSIGGVRTIDAYGERQVFGVDSPLPMTSDTSFDAGSITKVLATTAAIMRLIDAGEISLDAKASKYLSAWANTDKDQITIRDLLLHRSGLWEWRPLYISVKDPQRIVEEIAQMPLRYRVGEGRHYSDLGFISLGQILISLVGADLSTLVKDLVLKPLGLHATRYAEPVLDTPIAATSLGDIIEKEMVISKIPFPVPEEVTQFNRWRTHVLVGEVNDGNAFHLFGGISGHAGLFTNADDLLTFGEAMNSSVRDEGSYSGKVTGEFLSTGPDVGQQLGFRSWTSTHEGCTDEFFGHTGFPGVVLAFSPEHDCVVTLLTNRLHRKGEIPVTELFWQPFLSAIHKKIHG